MLFNNGWYHNTIDGSQNQETEGGNTKGRENKKKYKELKTVKKNKKFNRLKRKSVKINKNCCKKLQKGVKLGICKGMR